MSLKALNLIKQLAKELALRPEQVERTIKLFDEGNTMPFIARYRKEVTGGLDEEQLRTLEERLSYLRNLEARKEEVLRLIGEQGKLTPQLEEAIKQATILQEVEDYYRPFRPKRRTRATMAKEKGLEPLALMIWQQEQTSGDPLDWVEAYVNPELGVEDATQALAGALDIIAEQISEQAEWRRMIREYLWEHARITSELKTDDAAGAVYRQYHNYIEPVKKIPPHRTLAINRGEKTGFLKVGLQVELQPLLEKVSALVLSNPKSIFAENLKAATEDSLTRLLLPSLGREIRAALTATAEEQAIKVFALNLRQL
jgi:uncharacterized protein